MIFQTFDDINVIINKKGVSKFKTFDNQQPAIWWFVLTAQRYIPGYFISDWLAASVVLSKLVHSYF